MTVSHSLSLCTNYCSRNSHRKWLEMVNKIPKKCWRRIKTCFFISLYDCRPVVFTPTKNIVHPVAGATQRFSSLLPVYHILIVGNSNIFSASPTIGTITSYNIKISERRLFWIFLIEYFIFINSPKCLAQRQKHPSLPSLLTFTWLLIIGHQLVNFHFSKTQNVPGTSSKRRLLLTGCPSYMLTRESVWYDWQDCRCGVLCTEDW